LLQALLDAGGLWCLATMTESAGPASRARIAIIGGGVTGAVCAQALLRLSGQHHLAVTVFDQGRGLGGRACHRRLSAEGNLLPPDAPDAKFVFDHGCQFFRADSARFRKELLNEWLERGWAAEWKGSFGVLGTVGRPADFFGFPERPPFYCSVGGMSALPCKVLAAASAEGVSLRPGVRVASMQRLTSGAWLLSGTSGKAAFHDTAEEEAARASPDALGEFEAVVVTDVSASMASWHRASAGVPEAIASRVRDRTRVVLFTALFAFEKPLRLQHDGFAAADDSLWFAARARSKPGLADVGGLDCWTLVSTPKYAAAEITRVPMQDPETGAFRPQEMDYIREGPSADLLAAFERLLMDGGFSDCLPLPKAIYVGGQRWGSAFPAPAGVGGRDAVGRGSDTVEVLGIAYDGAATLPLAPDTPEVGQSSNLNEAKRDQMDVGGNDFLADDEQSIFYSSDYVSTRLPGFEAAALSALDAAQHVVSRMCPPQQKTTL